MNLPKKEVKSFYFLYHSLLKYVNDKFNFKKMPDNLFKADIADLWKLKEKLYDNPQIIDEYLEKNPQNLSKNHLKIIESWKGFIREDFVVVKYLKKYTIFLELKDPPRAYGVLGLESDFEELFGPPPVMVKTVLLPFKDHIIVDGLFQRYPIMFGGNYRKSINHEYQEAKFTFGIIESLPFDKKKKLPSTKEKLKFYLKNERNRFTYEEEISELISKDPQLLVLFHQEMGKISARKTGRYLRERGLSLGWFAILEDMVIGSGLKKADLKKTMEALVPPDKRNFIYYFQLK